MRTGKSYYVVRGGLIRRTGKADRRQSGYGARYGLKCLTEHTSTMTLTIRARVSLSGGARWALAVLWAQSCKFKENINKNVGCEANIDHRAAPNALMYSTAARF